MQEQQDGILPAGGAGPAGGQGQGHQGVAGGAEPGAGQAEGGAGALGGGQAAPGLRLQSDQQATQDQVLLQLSKIEPDMPEDGQRYYGYIDNTLQGLCPNFVSVIRS